jgi:plastocyanin
MTLTRRLFSLSCIAAPLTVLTVRPAAAATHRVSIKSMKFTPQTLSIAKGDSVTFLNGDKATHTATAKDGSFDTGHLKKGESATVRFDASGEHAYVCAIHASMKGKIAVV